VISVMLAGLSGEKPCRRDHRCLVVRGNLCTYKIHLGSANIQMKPNDRYLCSVRGRGRSEGSSTVERFVLPFEGDGTLSIILSKAFMPAADDSIADPTILRQIKPAHSSSRS
jgi:hypothetical protein